MHATLYCHSLVTKMSLEVMPRYIVIEQVPSFHHAIEICIFVVCFENRVHFVRNVQYLGDNHMTSLGRLLIMPIVTVITWAVPVGVAMPMCCGMRVHPHDVHGVLVASPVSPNAAASARHERAVL